MATKTQQPTVSRISRPGAGKGNKGRSPLRDVRNKRTGIVAPRFNRLCAITFAPITGADVIFKQTGNRVFDQLFACYSRYHFLVTGQPAEPIDSVDINSINAEFLKLIGDAKLNIDKYSDIEDQHFYTIYQEAKADYGWYLIDIKNILVHLRRENEALHHLFIVFLKCLGDHTGVEFWYDYTMESALDWFDEQFENFKDEYGDDPAEIEEYQRVYDEYHTGLAVQYQQMIKEACKWEPRELIDEILSQQIDHPIVDVMVKGCEIAAEGHNIFQFDYNPEANEDSGEEAMMFPSSFNIIWNWDDPVTELHRQWLDDTSGNCGVLDPYKWCVVKPDSDQIYSPEGIDWPLRLQEFFMHANTVIDQILLKKNEQDDTTSAKQL